MANSLVEKSRASAESGSAKTLSGACVRYRQLRSPRPPGSARSAPFLRHRFACALVGRASFRGTGRGRALTGISRRLRGREPDWNMATCAEILRSEFPEIDGQVFDYVTGKPNRINALGMSKWKSGRGKY